MKVMGPRLLVRRREQELKSSVIEVVSYDESPSHFAEVVVVTEVYKNTKGHTMQLDVEPGDVVVTKQYCGTPAMVNGELLYFIEYDDCLAVIRES